MMTKESKLLVLKDHALIMGEVSKIDKNDTYIIDWPIIITMTAGAGGRPIIRLLAYPLGIEAIGDFSDGYGIEVSGSDVRCIMNPTTNAWKEYDAAVKALYINLDIPTNKEVVQFS